MSSPSHCHPQVLPYSLLLTALSLPSVPALEDLLIDAIYQGLLGARLDQREAQVEVTNSLGRDVRPAPATAPTPTPAIADDNMEVDAAPAVAGASLGAVAPSGQTVAYLGSALQAWLGTVHALLDSLSQHLAKVQADAVNERLVLQQQDAEVNRVLGTVAQETGAAVKGKGKVREEGDSAAGGGGGRGFLAGVGRMLDGGGAGAKRRRGVQ